MTVRPASVTFRLYQGATFSEPVIIKNAAGDPVDLTGCTAKLQARRDISDADPPVLDLSTSNSGIVIDGPAGKITLNVTAAATALLTIDWAGEVWFHDLKLTFPDTTAQRTYQGAIIVYPAVTRS